MPRPVDLEGVVSNLEAGRGCHGVTREGNIEGGPAVVHHCIEEPQSRAVACNSQAILGDYKFPPSGKRA